MFGKTMISGAVISLVVGLPVAAQTETVVREAIPAQRQVIIANSPQDIALQEEIRKIRAYNAYVDSQIGLSSTEEVVEVVEPVNTGSNAKIELFETPTTNLTYTDVSGESVSVTPVVTIIERKPLVGRGGIHTIKQGDTLYRFARNRCITVNDIQSLNDLESTSIRLGQKISLPASTCKVIEASAITAQKENIRVVMPVPTGAEITRNYAVLPKDSLYSIGRQYCLSATDLASHNGISTTKAIQPGQILRLPDAACIK